MFWLMAAVLVGCETTKPEVVLVETGCSDGLDDDSDGFVDCMDPDCAASCPESVCGDGVDDDVDGLIDCADPDCDGVCGEICDDGRDNDGDSLVDCEDSDCFGSCPEVCDDGYDNDGNGLVDCLDEACNDPACPEFCSDGRDNDADGLVDCEDADCVSPSCPEICDDGRDNDADGRADCDDSDCDGDCPEVCSDGRDNDADALVDCDDDECTAVCDADGDGFDGVAYGGEDCDDTRAEVNPSRPEICNDGAALDDDCNGLVDEADPGIDPFSLIDWYVDDDGDGHGDGGDVLFACLQPPGRVTGNADCDDGDPEVNPDMPEICNADTPKDDDCDGLVDDADPDVSEDSFLAWFADRDGDGYGSGVDFEYACSRPEGTAASDDDCDDTDPEVGPPALWYGDGDGDGFGAGDPVDDDVSCEPPYPGLRPGWLGLDCDDLESRIYPGAPEVCEDGIDQDCDGADPSCTTGRFLLSEWNEDAVYLWDVLADTYDLYHAYVSNDADCNAHEGSELGWLADHYDDHIATFEPGTGVGIDRVIDTPYSYPKHLAVYNGELVVMSRNDGTLYRYDLSGADIARIATGYGTGQGVATDGDHLFVSVWTGTGALIQEYDAAFRLLDTHEQPSGLSGDNLVDLAWDPETETWYGLDAVGEGGTGTNTNRVVRWSVMGGPVTDTFILPYDVDGIGIFACD